MAGIYIHIPFCKQACTYCNFHFSTSLKQKDALLNALKEEIILTSHDDGSELIETIYFGGGTPSILEPSEIEMILQTLVASFKIDDAAEITLEANPDDISQANVGAWKTSGINRFSLGLQSLMKMSCDG